MRGTDGEALEGTLTRLIGQVEAGDPAAVAQICELVYQELRRIGRVMRRRSPGSSLATTDLVHEFLGRLVSDGRLGQMKNRRYFFATAADQMRRLLIDHWTKNQREKHGGKRKRVPLEPWLDEMADSVASRCGGDLEALDAALTKLKHERPRQHEIVQLKFFVGLTNEQVAEALGISVDAVKRDWKKARARLGACLIDKESCSASEQQQEKHTNGNPSQAGSD